MFIKYIVLCCYLIRTECTRSQRDHELDTKSENYAIDIVTNNTERFIKINSGDILKRISNSSGDEIENKAGGGGGGLGDLGGGLGGGHGGGNGGGLGAGGHTKKKKKKHRREESLLEKVLPMMIIPFIVSSLIIPKMLLIIKFLIIKGLLVGIVAAGLVIMNMFRGRQAGGGVINHNVGLR